MMVVGDSISNGYEGDSTLRYRLWEWARDQNWQARFVGPLTGAEKQNAAHPPEPPPLVENAADPPPAQPDPSQFTGLTPGHHYQVYMCSWNASGEGMPSIAEGTVVP
ncbi:hypothetical protein ABZ876_08030 [Streptomyces sp. NPDC046931]|uniref:hypothetical protein n=1 Tax=Streptomyces sp. NPDC046931 TaxID=3154806 RepID=UPI00340B11CB